jgi:uncharacterized protein involved in exopolysaccharide biosynthesis
VLNMADREPNILPYEPKPRRNNRRWWLAVQIALTVVVAIAVIRSLRSSYTATGTITIAPLSVSPITTTLQISTTDMTSEVIVIRSKKILRATDATPRVEP